MVYNGINSSIGYVRGRHDAANSVVAGALSGMLFKSTRGVRPMMVSGGLVAGAAGAWAVSLSYCFARLDVTDVLCIGDKEDAVLRCRSKKHHVFVIQSSFAISYLDI